MYIVHGSIHFEWDDHKASSNERKHGVTFDDALTVFFDDDALLQDDPDRASHEERFVLLGTASSLRVLVVCHCYRRAGNVIRIISSRRATRGERMQYQERRTP